MRCGEFPEVIIRDSENLLSFAPFCSSVLKPYLKENRRKDRRLSKARGTN